MCYSAAVASSSVLQCKRDIVWVESLCVRRWPSAERGRPRVSHGDTTPYDVLRMGLVPPRSLSDIK